MMVQSFTLPPRSKDDFWNVVYDCLHEFRGKTPPAAADLVANLRKAVEDAPPEFSSDIFYHAEPFDMACDLAGQPLKLDPLRHAYDAILNQHKW